MKSEVRYAALTAVLLLGGSLVSAQPRRPATAQRDTWYEFLLKQCNLRNVDYGARLERRRQMFLEATVREPTFWYSASVTAGMLVVLLAYTKLHLDYRRSLRITSEMMADLYTHDLYSRRAANEAIRKYNEHIEQCNREMEAEESSDIRPAEGRPAIESLEAELERVAAELEAMTQERDALQDELGKKTVIVADPSTRLDNVSRKRNEAGDVEDVSRTPSPDGKGERARWVGQVRDVPEERHADRQKNKRSKGA